MAEKKIPAKSGYMESTMNVLLINDFCLGEEHDWSFSLVWPEWKLSVGSLGWSGEVQLH